MNVLVTLKITGKIMVFSAASYFNFSITNYVLDERCSIHIYNSLQYDFIVYNIYVNIIDVAIIVSGSYPKKVYLLDVSNLYLKITVSYNVIFHVVIIGCWNFTYQVLWIYFFLIYFDLG